MSANPSQTKPRKIKLKSLLSDREYELLALLAKGYTYKQIADKMGISQGNHRRTVYSLYRRLGLPKPPEGGYGHTAIPAVVLFLRENPDTTLWYEDEHVELTRTKRARRPNPKGEGERPAGAE